MLQKPYNIIFIPIWLENAMARSGMNFTDALNEDKLLGILSKSDVVFYLLANRYFKEMFLDSVIESKFFNASKQWSCNDEVSTLVMIQSDIEAAANLSKNDRFNKYAFGETIDLEAIRETSYALNATLIDDVNIIVTVRVSSKKIEAYKMIGSLYDQILRVLNMSFPFHVLATAAIFKRYCKQLSIGVQ